MLNVYMTPMASELYIDHATGEAFTSIRGYARLVGKDESTIRERVERGSFKGAGV